MSVFLQLRGYLEENRGARLLGRPEASFSFSPKAMYVVFEVPRSSRRRPAGSHAPSKPWDDKYQARFPPLPPLPFAFLPPPATQGGQAAGGGRGEQACVGRALRGVSAGVPGHLLVAGGGAGGARGVVLQPPSAGRGGRFGGQSERLDVFVGFQKVVGDLEASRRF